MKRLVVVESPTKARTIRRFLPDDEYTVEACMGHVRDLPASASEIPKEKKSESWSRLGVNVNDGFEPIYVVPQAKKKVVSGLKSALKDADEFYIATDEDREGESIGWHLLEVLSPKVPVRRMVFHEITRSAIESALKNTRELDRQLVESQETRRILDRLVGYEISPLLWRKIAPKLSAGRVQSAAVRLLVRREAERIRFKRAAYWGLAATLGARSRSFQATATHIENDQIASGQDFDENTGRLRSDREVLLIDEDGARRLAESFANGTWQVTSVERQNQTRRPYAPFITSTLQQEANRKLGLSARDTMRVAQNLYEQGHITYMRTDSVSLSREAISAARSTISQKYGSEYLSKSPRKFKSNPRSAQEAHEAIRPAGTEMRTAPQLGLKGREAALYDLIWKRTVASQMADAKLVFTVAQITAEGADGTTGRFRASGKTVEFPGFFRAYVEGSDDPEAALEDQENPLPPIDEDEALDCEGVKPTDHETRPPARYTDASLVRELEKLGIGRPSTYASIIGTIIERGYSRRKGKQLIPTFTAFATNNLLEHQFKSLVDFDFTARMEEVLDEIAEGKVEAGPYLKEFYFGDDDGLKRQIEEGLDEIDPREVSTISFADWKPYVIRVGKYGPYVDLEKNGERITASLPSEMPPDEVTRDYLGRLLEDRETQGKKIAVDPETGKPILIREGPYGPYLQLGEAEGDETPKRVSIPKGLEPSELTEQKAIDLMALPRGLGVHPETGKTIEAAIGRYGPYVRHERTFASLPKSLDVLEVTLEEALPLLEAKASGSRGGRELGKHPETGEPVVVLSGRYGPYVKHKRTNASLPKDVDKEEVTLEQALELLAAKASKPKRSSKKRKKS